MIIDNAEMIDLFVRHFNSRLTTSAFKDNVNELRNILNGQGNRRFSRIILPCKSQNVFEQLIKFRYPELLTLLAQRVTLDKELYDIFLSEMDENVLFTFLTFLEYSTSQFHVINQIEFNQFHIEAPELFVDILLSMFSQLHTEVTLQLEHFNRIISLNALTSDKPTENLFLNSKVPTAYSSFILTYVAENLNIKLQL